MLDKLCTLLSCKPKNCEQLIKLLRSLQAKAVLDPEALTMIEGVLQISQMQARDIMIPRAQMTAIDEDATLSEIIAILAKTNHSRFPVIDNDQNHIEGILLAKDLLPYTYDSNLKFNLRDLLRQAIAIPESKRLNSLLAEFRDTKNHMAIVIDEYGNPAGLITIEDVIEQIVGEIEDEYDVDPNDLIKQLDAKTYTLKAQTSMQEFNEFFEKPLENQGCDTIGGLIIKKLGHLPKRDEIITIDTYTFKILHADNRKIRMLEMHIDS